MVERLNHGMGVRIGVDQGVGVRGRGVRSDGWERAWVEVSDY